MTQDAKPKEIKRPEGSIANLQKARGLENDRALYMNCRVSVSSFVLIKHHCETRSMVKSNPKGCKGINLMESVVFRDCGILYFYHFLHCRRNSTD
jgi:hypothetical protein